MAAIIVLAAKKDVGVVLMVDGDFGTGVRNLALSNKSEVRKENSRRPANHVFQIECIIKTAILEI